MKNRRRSHVRYYLGVVAGACIGVVMTGNVNGAEASKDAEWEAKTGFVVESRTFDVVLQPKDILGLRLWLDAGKGVEHDSTGKVSVWEDLSGNGWDALQKDATSMPSWVPAALGGGRPAIRFTGGASEGMGLSTVEVALREKEGAPEAMTLVYVARVDSTGLFFNYGTGHRLGDVQVEAARNDACAAVHRVLREGEHAHYNVKGMGQDEYRDKCLENPLEYYERVEIRHIVSFDDKVYQFVTDDECKYHARYGHDHRF